LTQQTTTKYRIRNLADYNKALVQRGSLTIWFSPEAVEGWLCAKEGKRGRPTLYSQEAILCALMLKAVYHLPFRALRGLLLSLVILRGVVEIVELVPVFRNRSSHMRRQPISYQCPSFSALPKCILLSRVMK